MTPCDAPLPAAAEHLTPGTAVTALALLAAGAAWAGFFHWWLRERPFLREQGTQDLSLIGSCGCLLFSVGAFLLVVLPLLNSWLLAVPLGAWLTFVAVYLFRREW
jgi:hypothetical protein